MGSFGCSEWPGRLEQVGFSDEAQLRQLALYWGVLPRLLTLPQLADTDTLVDRVTQTMLEQKLVTHGDRFVMAFGSPVGQRTPTNAIGVISV